MKKKGFTLIELLAVIVILGVIMVIAIPAVSHLITKSKKDAMKQSASGLLSSATLYYSSNQQAVEGSAVVFTFVNGVQTSTSSSLLTYDGKIENGRVYLYTDGSTAICIYNSENIYAKKLSTDLDIETGSGTCDFTDTGFVVVSEYQELLDKYNDLVLENETLKDEAAAKTGNATSNQILEGYSAYVNGTKVDGTYKALPFYLSTMPVTFSVNGYNTGSGTITLPDTFAATYDDSKYAVVVGLKVYGASSLTAWWVGGEGFALHDLPASAITKTYNATTKQLTISWSGIGVNSGSGTYAVMLYPVSSSNYVSY